MEGKHSALIGLLSGAGLTAASTVFSTAFPKVAAEVAAVTFWSGILIGLAGVVGLLFPLLRKDKLTVERLPLAKFLYMAELQGWVFKGEGHDALKLLDTLAQAFADGVLLAWGRRQGANVLLPISAEEWRVLRVDLATAFDCGPSGEIRCVQTDNSEISCFESGSGFTAKYSDLHVSASSVAWLRGLR